MPLPRRKQLGGQHFVHVHAPAFTVKAHRAVRDRKDGVVLAKTNAAARNPLGAALADDDVAGNDLLAAEFLDAESLALAVAPVLDGSLTFLVCHDEGVGK